MIPAVEVDNGAHDMVRTVTYSKNVEPQEPTTPPDDNPTGPKDSPENPETPQAETSNRSNGPKSELLMKRIKSNNVPKSMVNNSHSTAIDNKAKTNGETLPQTGEKSSKIGIILGLLTISLASLFGLGKKDRKED